MKPPSRVDGVPGQFVLSLFVSQTRIERWFKKGAGRPPIESGGVAEGAARYRSLRRRF